MPKDGPIYDKYIVVRRDGQDTEWCFVLEYGDPFAVPALQAYANAARDGGFLLLADDIEDRLAYMQ